MINARVVLTPHVHLVLSQAKRKAGIANMHTALGAFLAQAIGHLDDAEAVAEEMLEGMSVYMRAEGEMQPGKIVVKEPKKKGKSSRKKSA